MDFCSQLSSRLLIDAMKKSTEKNLVVSPLSFNIILNMTAEGSSGSTQDNLLNLLGFDEINGLNSSSAKMMSIASGGDDTKGGPIVHLLDGVWIDKKYSLKPSHEELVRRVYKAEIKAVDFENKGQEIVEDANAWAKASTKGLVTDVLMREDVKRDAALILGNALYFKGNWETIFDPRDTRDLYFNFLNGKKLLVPFMTGCNCYSHNSFDGFELVKIPYRTGEDDKKFSMYIFLPNETNGLENLLQKAASDSTFLRQHFELKTWHYDIFWIPKLKFSYRASDEVLDTMKQMGLPTPFGLDGVHFKGLIETLPFTKIVQKAFIVVDEAGTEAAAVTFGGYLCGGMPRKAITKFIADHPFMFMIREDETKLVPFTGAVLNPLQD